MEKSKDDNGSWTAWAIMTLKPWMLLPVATKHCHLNSWADDLCVSCCCFFLTHMNLSIDNYRKRFASLLSEVSSLKMSDSEDSDFSDNQSGSEAEEVEENEVMSVWVWLIWLIDGCCWYTCNKVTVQIKLPLFRLHQGFLLEKEDKYVYVLAACLHCVLFRRKEQQV